MAFSILGMKFRNTEINWRSLGYYRVHRLNMTKTELSFNHK